MRRRELEQHARELGFTPRPAVRWLDPPELARTAARVIVAKLFADFGDKRELQAVFAGGPVTVSSPEGEDLWIDYAADLGDGFDATYTVASLLAEDDLEVEAPGNGTLTLPRGDLLVLGGDEVYPTASARSYEDRTTGPFAAALPPRPGLSREPSVVALPGNHDWYDGLTSFLRIFTHGRRIGGWRTVQSRSYFVINLRPGWWLVGLDSQLSEYIDEPQLAYFAENLTAHLRPGDAVIVCSAAPAWVHTETEGPDGFNQLHYFEKNYVRNRTDPITDERTPTGAHVRLWLSGDSHHYSRYQEASPGVDADGGTGRDPRAVQAITCGLGGAFLSSTHRLPDRLELPPAGSRMRSKDVPGTPFLRGPVTYPDMRASRRLAARIANPASPMFAAWRNPRFAWTAGLLHVLLFVLGAWLLGIVLGTTGREAIRAPDLAQVAWFSGLSAAGAILLTLAGWAWSSLRSGSPGPPTALVLASSQVVAAALILVGIAAVPWPASWADGVVLALAAVLALLAGAFVGVWTFTLAILTKSTGNPAMWQMSGQAIEDDKGFLRIRLRADGTLEVHPVVVDRVCRDWAVGSGPDGHARAVPAHGLPRARLLEEPIVISRKGF